ncbi:diaminopimelate decarboxylase [Salsuginibacillus kocurii]|uniref:diaminopimelate decarboxylase n=1 Tax=Salsuginibacillus kocurii TaxID=427078 RepID=UPI00035CF9DE|nr:diaminopimelate decarboxylase [Salsuginibacillus kocurii]
MKLQGSSHINEQGRLEIGGVDTIALTKQYGTPVYAYDLALIRERAAAFHEAFQEAEVSYQIAYASKAFSCIAMVQLAQELDLSLDVVSGGELYTAKKAGFPMERVHMHGNNKSPEEIKMGVEYGVGCFVVDNFYELELLQQEAQKLQKEVRILLRTTPGIEAHTHDYISTGQEDSKFGFDLASGQGAEAVNAAISMDHLHLLGVHCHIGSQIFETIGFVMAVEKLYESLRSWKESFGFVPEVVNVGGGFGIRYTEEDQPLHPGTYVDGLVQAIKEEAKASGMPVPEVWIEPGRSLVGEAGTTLYTVGSSKDVPEVRRYIAVDGGMTDNIRPALYQAEYEGILANRPNEEKSEQFSVAGKCCESGDMLIWDLPLPEVKSGDVLAVFSTGAYGYSMANNYNRITRPPVIFLENGEANVVVRGETYDDIIMHDEPLYKTEKV